MTYRKILIPLDGSESAENALPFAKLLGGPETLMVLFSVCPEDELRLCRLNMAYLEVQSKILGETGFQAKSHAEPGDLADRIKAYIGNEKVDLVVVCRQGYSDLSREEKVLQNLVTENCSLLLVKPNSKQKSKINKILLPLDGSFISENVVPHVIRLASVSGAQVTLVSVNGFPEIPSDRPPAAKPSWEEYALILMRETREQASEYLQRVADRFRNAGVKAQFRVVFGDVAESIRRESDEENVDVIAMATHGRTGLDRWVYGSVAARVSASTTLPMLLVHSSDHS